MKDKKYPLKTFKKGINDTAKTKWGTDGQTQKKIETDGSCAIWKLNSLTVYKISFLLFVTFDIILGRHNYLFDTKLWFCHSQVISQVS